MTEKQPKTKKINDLEALATLVRSGNYAIPILDLGDRDSDGDPKLKQVPLNLLQSLFKTETNLHKVATTGKYSDLKNLPQLFSGNYADLQGKPSLFSGDYADLQGKPSLFSGDYGDLQNKPDLSHFLTQHQDISNVTFFNVININHDYTAISGESGTLDTGKAYYDITTLFESVFVNAYTWVLVCLDFLVYCQQTPVWVMPWKKVFSNRIDFQWDENYTNNLISPQDYNDTSKNLRVRFDCRETTAERFAKVTYFAGVNAPSDTYNLKIQGFAIKTKHPNNYYWGLY